MQPSNHFPAVRHLRRLGAGTVLAFLALAGARPAAAQAYDAVPIGAPGDLIGPAAINSHDEVVGTKQVLVSDPFSSLRSLRVRLASHGRPRASRGDDGPRKRDGFGHQ